MTHPHDVALLYDLVDGRLGEHAADDLRRRIEEEPALRAAWEETRRLREELRGLPGPAVPGDFLAQVRARGGFADAAVPAAPAGRLLRLRRARPWLAAAAAVALAVLVGEGWLALRGRPRGAPAPVRETARQDAPAAGIPRAEVGPSAPPATATAAETASPEGKAREGGGTFRAPGGAVPPGLREPAEAGPPPPAAPPVREGTGGAGGGAAVPVPGVADAPGSRPDLGSPASPAGVPTPEPASGRGPVPSAGAGAERALAEAQAAEALGKARASAASAARRGAPGAKTAAPGRVPFAWAHEGADEVLVLRAASADEARAQVGLLVAALEDRGALPALDLSRAPPGLPAEGGGPAEARKDVTRRGASAQGGGGARAADAEAPAAEVALLTFRLDLSPASWARLEGALAPRPGGTDDADDKAPPAAAPATPAPAEAPPAKPSAPPSAADPPSGAGDGAPPAPRRVRIVVLPR